MKLILCVIALTMSGAAAFSLTRNGDSFDFDYDHSVGSLPVGLRLAGTFDKDDASKREINAFINLFGTMFPIVEDVMSPTEHLEFKRNQCFTTLGFCYNLEIHFYIGWTVDQIGVDDEFYNVTYTPFAHGVANAGTSLETGFFKLSMNGATDFFRFDVPMSFEFEDFSRVCYSSFSRYYPTQAVLTGESRVLECQTDLSDGQLNNWGCNYNSPLALTFFNHTIDGNSYKNLHERSCLHKDN